MPKDNPAPSHRSSDDELSSLLRGSLGCEPPDEAFVTSLGVELEAELQAVWATNAQQHSVVASTEDGSAAVSRSARKSERIGRRSFAVLAVAAMLVVAVSIWSSRPSYSWTSMLRALEDQPWIESTTDAEAQTDVRTWFSRPHRLVIVRSGNDVVWNDLREKLQSRYQSASGLLQRGPLTAAESLSAEQAFLSLLSAGKPPDHNPADNPPSRTIGVTLLSQTWRNIGAGDNRRIELDVVLRAKGADPSTMHLLIQLDPRTQLPLSMQRIDQQANVTETVRFNYPPEGPTQLSDVGVPADVVVQEVASFDAASQLAAADPIDLLEVVVDQLATDRKLPQNIPPMPEPADDENVTTPAVPPLHTAPAPPPAVSFSADEMSRRIDELLAAQWANHGVTPTSLSDDAEFHRRVYLDLTGRIPTVNECREFPDNPAPDRRTRLVESLLARRDHATHLGAVWRRILLPDGVDLSPYGGSSSFEEWLSERFRNNVPYDQTVRELL